MIYKTASTKPDHLCIVFELPASLWADRVFLVGDFNQWNPMATPLVQDREGIWRVSIDLPVNASYAFRYLVDGHWQSDYRADGWSMQIPGLPSSLVQTDPPTALI